MAERATRQMLDGIAAFRDAYKNDPKFKDAISKADALEEEAEKLVPAAYDRTSDPADSPKTLPEATKAARQQFANARKGGESKDATEPSKDAK